MKLSSFETLRFSDMVEIRKIAKEDISPELYELILKRFPPSAKWCQYLSNGEITMSPKSGLYEFKIIRRGMHVVCYKTSCTINNSANTITYATINRGEENGNG